MATQPEYFDLCDLEHNFDIKIIGSHKSGKINLQNNILHILKAKNYKVVQPHTNYAFYDCTHNDKLKKLQVALCSEDNGYGDDLVFFHVDHAKSYITHFGYKITEGIDFTNKDDFFVFQHKEFKFKCQAENNSTYSTIFDKNPFCYNTIAKLVYNISNKYSMFYSMYSGLHIKLQIRLKSLYKAYCTIFCMKNIKNDSLQLPSELNSEIIKLFCLSFP